MADGRVVVNCIAHAAPTTERKPLGETVTRLVSICASYSELLSTISSS
jgi:hypothetical protein